MYRDRLQLLMDYKTPPIAFLMPSEDLRNSKYHQKLSQWLKAFP